MNRNGQGMYLRDGIKNPHAKTHGILQRILCRPRNTMRKANCSLSKPDCMQNGFGRKGKKQTKEKK